MSAERKGAGSPLALFAASLVVVIVVVAVRLYRLDDLQAEVYGDIDIILVYMERILGGEWPWTFVLSSGPLYHYLIAPAVLIGGNTYETLKLASVAVSLATLAATWGFARRLARALGPLPRPDAFALTALFIAGTGSWLLVFSRLGNSQIEVPLVTMLALLALTRAVQRDSVLDYAAAGAIGALGLYAYPQSFVLPGVLVLVLLALKLAGWRIAWPRIAVFMAATTIAAMPFAAIFAANPGAFLHGYVGGKLSADGSALDALALNSLHALGAFFWTGDTTTRSNPFALPHVDPVTAVLMLFGIACWLATPERRRYAPLLLIPLLALQLPSILVLGRPHEVPSASRTLAVAPIVAVLAASGLWWILRPLAHRSARAAILGAVVVLAVIGALNRDRYFNRYIHGLPAGNTPIGLLVARYADSLAPGTHLIVVGCCWAEGAMPEAQYVKRMTDRPVDQVPSTLTCADLAALPRPSVLVWTPDAVRPGAIGPDCPALGRPDIFVSATGMPIFRAAAVEDAPP